MSSRRLPGIDEVSAVVCVDSAQRVNGVAVFLRRPSDPMGFSATPVHWLVHGIENAGDRSQWDHAQIPKDGKVFVLLECPTWSGHGTKEVRAAANAWERTLNATFKSRSIRRVDPRVWQRQLLHGAPGLDTKSKSLWYVRNVLRYLGDVSHDEADAICIAYYGVLMLNRLVAA